MKKVLLALVLVLGLMAVVDRTRAEDPIILKQWGEFKIFKPLNTVNLVVLYDAWNGQGLWGGESPIIGFGSRLRANVGCMATTPQAAKEGDGRPYVSVDYDFLQIYPTILEKLSLAENSTVDFRMGVFIGYDPELIRIVNNKEQKGNWRVGTKGSYKFF